jgi:hypothetical protein
MGVVIEGGHLCVGVHVQRHRCFVFWGFVFIYSIWSIAAGITFSRSSTLHSTKVVNEKGQRKRKRRGRGRERE